MRTTAERSVTHTATISTNKETETGSQELDFNARLKKRTLLAARTQLNKKKN
jgi:hypothetical protein